MYVEHRSSLVVYATSLLGSRALAEDIVQEAWLRFDQAARTRGVREPTSYLYRIVRNLALDARRTAARLGRWEEETARAESEASAPSPEQVAGDRAELRLLLEALEELPQRTRIAFGMHRLGGYKLREIAAHLGISLALTQNLVTDGLDHCKHRLGWP